MITRWGWQVWKCGNITAVGILQIVCKRINKALELLLLFNSTFRVLKPRIGCFKASSITKKDISNPRDSSSPWPVNSKAISPQTTNGISAWFPHWALSLSYGSKISSVLETLYSFKWVFNQALGINDTCAPVSRRTWALILFILQLRTHFQSIGLPGPFLTVPGLCCRRLPGLFSLGFQ